MLDNPYHCYRYCEILLSYFIQVTDIEILDILTEYQLKEVHLKAFLQVSHKGLISVLQTETASMDLPV